MSCTVKVAVRRTQHSVNTRTCRAFPVFVREGAAATGMIRSGHIYRGSEQCQHGSYYIRGDVMVWFLVFELKGNEWHQRMTYMKRVWN